jgi:tetratricopeptide (TPR) repeat protein
MRALADRVPQPSFDWLRLLDECIWALIQGDLQSSERLANEAFEAGSASGEPDAALFLGGQLFIIRHQQNRAGELADQFVQLVGLPESLPAWRAAAAVCLTQGGRFAEAGQLVLAEDFRSVPMDAAWSGTMYGWAEVCSELGLEDRAQGLYDLLVPFSAQIASGGSILYGSFAWVLGKLAATLELYEQADEHFALAARVDQNFGVPLFLARTHASWARALIERGRPEDLDRVGPMLEQAEQAAQFSGAEGITRVITKCKDDLATINRPRP